jgi:hypothetical protein
MKSAMLSMGSPKNFLAALAFDLHQTALDGADAGGTDVAVFGGVLAGVVAHVLAHGAQVLHVQQQQAVVVGNLEHQLQHTGLGVVQVQHAGQQQRPQVADGGAHRVALFAKHVPQGGWKRLVRGLRQAALCDDFVQLGLGRARFVKCPSGPP